MSSSDELSVSTIGHSASPTPGQQLRLAREAGGLSLNDVNAETNLSVKYLQALEADDFAALPGLAFARGYARRYAQLVHLDGATLIAEIDALAASKGVVVTPALTSSNPAMQRASLGISEVSSRKASDVPSVMPKLMAILQQVSFSQVLSMGSLLLLLLLLLGTLFWQGNKSDVMEPLADHGVIDIDAEVVQQVPPEAPITPETINSSVTPPVASELAGAVTGEQPVIDAATSPAVAPTTPALPAAPTVTPTAAPAGLPQAPAPSTVSPAPAPAPVATPALIPAAKPTAGVPAQPMPAATPVTKPAVPATGIKPVAQAATPPGIESLNFSFSGKSWISVRDATGQELVYGLKNAGQAVTVTGQAPFSINIGNVNVTALSRNGRGVNLKQYARGEIASFRLAPVAPAPVPKP